MRAVRVKVNINAIKKARSNIEIPIDFIRLHSNEKDLEILMKLPAVNNNEVDNEQQQQLEMNNITESLDDSIIRSSVLKSFELIKNNDAVSGIRVS